MRSQDPTLRDLNSIANQLDALRQEAESLFGYVDHRRSERAHEKYPRPNSSDALPHLGYAIRQLRRTLSEIQTQIVSDVPAPTLLRERPMGEDLRSRVETAPSATQGIAFREIVLPVYRDRDVYVGAVPGKKGDRHLLGVDAVEREMSVFGVKSFDLHLGTLPPTRGSVGTYVTITRRRENNEGPVSYPYVTVVNPNPTISNRESTEYRVYRELFNLFDRLTEDRSQTLYVWMDTAVW